MPAKRFNYIAAMPRLQHSRFLADNFECGVDPQTGQVIRDSQRRIICNRIHVIFGIKPEDDVGSALSSAKPDADKEQKQEAQHGLHCIPKVLTIVCPAFTGAHEAFETPEVDREVGGAHRDSKIREQGFAYLRIDDRVEIVK